MVFFGSDGLLVVLLCCGITLVQEFAMYLMLYRTSNFKSMKSAIDKQSKKLEELRSKEVAVNSKAVKGDKRKKKEERLEASLKKDMMRALGPQRMQTTAFTAITMFFAYQYITRTFDGVIVARLPFEPFQLLRKLSHRGISGTDYSQCSVAFIYMLCQVGVRPIIAKALGWGPSRAMNSVNALTAASQAEKFKAT